MSIAFFDFFKISFNANDSYLFTLIENCSRFVVAPGGIISLAVVWCPLLGHRGHSLHNSGAFPAPGGPVLVFFIHPSPLPIRSFYRPNFRKTPYNFLPFSLLFLIIFQSFSFNFLSKPLQNVNVFFDFFLFSISFIPLSSTAPRAAPQTTRSWSAHTHMSVRALKQSPYSTARWMYGVIFYFFYFWFDKENTNNLLGICSNTC